MYWQCGRRCAKCSGPNTCLEVSYNEGGEAWAVQSGAKVIASLVVSGVSQADGQMLMSFSKGG